MPHLELDPPEALQDTIRCFWHTRNDFDMPQSTIEVLPDGYAEIIFHFGPLHRVAKSGALQPLPSPFMVGMLHQPMLLRTGSILEVLGVRCFPWTIYDLLGLPSGKEDVRTFEHPIAQLQPVLEACIRSGDVDGAFLCLQQYFLEARAHVPSDSLLHKAGAAMQEANGTLPVSGVAAAAHATVRTLERRFKQSSGHTVKDVSGVMRFEQARNRLWHEPGVNLAGLAAELGYADQAHLGREFKRYSGVTPAAFLRNMKRKRQLFDDDFVAFIQA